MSRLVLSQAGVGNANWFGDDRTFSRVETHPSPPHETHRGNRSKIAQRVGEIMGEIAGERFAARPDGHAAAWFGGFVRLFDRPGDQFWRLLLSAHLADDLELRPGCRRDFFSAVRPGLVRG